MKIWILILNYLSLLDLFNFQFTSKCFYEIVHDEKSFKRHNKIFEKTVNFKSWHYILKSNLKKLTNKFFVWNQENYSKYFSEETYLISILEKKIGGMALELLILLVFAHLFRCKKSYNIKSNCLKCARIFFLMIVWNLKWIIFFIKFIHWNFHL